MLQASVGQLKNMTTHSLSISSSMDPTTSETLSMNSIQQTTMAKTTKYSA